jgi:hypothetical protein
MKSPSQYLSRKYLQALKVNNYLSERGVEYCACEVDRLLIEKNSSLGESEADKLLKERFKDASKIYSKWRLVKTGAGQRWIYAE